jgi:type IV secretory pathway protease TraF
MGAVPEPVIAIAGDHIGLGERDMSVNGRIVPGSGRIRLGAGEISAGRYSVEADELWVLSTSHPRSFDSRYFGAIRQSRIQGVASPVWVWR